MQLEQQETFEITGPQLEVLGRAESKLPAPARKKPVAALALAALALVSVLGIGGVKLRMRYDRTLALYTRTDEYGNGILQDQDAQADAAASLIRLGERILGEQDETVARARNALDGWNASDKQAPRSSTTATPNCTAPWGTCTWPPTRRRGRGRRPSWKRCTPNSPPARR